MHAPAAASEYWPAGHCDAVDEAEPAGHAYPAVHAPLHVEVVSPFVLPYCPSIPIMITRIVAMPHDAVIAQLEVTGGSSKVLLCSS